MRIGGDTSCIDPFPRQLLDDESAHMLVADTGDDGAFQAQSRRAAGDVGGASADIFAERPHVLQAAADLGAVKIDAGSANGDDVQ